MFADPHGPNSTVFFTLDTVPLEDSLLLNGEWKPVIEAVQKKCLKLDVMEVIVVAFGSRYVSEKAVKIFQKYFEVVYPGLEYMKVELHPIFEDTVLLFTGVDFSKVKQH